MITRSIVLGTQHIPDECVEETLFEYQDAVGSTPLFIDIYPGRESSVKDHIFMGEWKVTTTVQDRPLVNQRESLRTLDIDAVHQTLLDMESVKSLDSVLQECETLYRSYQCTVFGLKNVQTTDIFDTVMQKIESLNLPISTVQGTYDEELCCHLKETDSRIRYEVHSPLEDKDLQLRKLARHSKLNILPSINALDACVLHATVPSDICKDVFSFLRGQPIQ
jgi:hypothetical protein